MLVVQQGAILCLLAQLVYVKKKRNRITLIVDKFTNLNGIRNSL